MLFDFPLFTGFVAKAYRDLGENAYTFENVLNIFGYYFTVFEDAFSRPHPPIRVEQIKRIIEKMPYIDAPMTIGAVLAVNRARRLGLPPADIVPEDYEPLIDKHFQTEYNVGHGGCDYNVNHFFSGDIRQMRYYETLYRGDAE